MGLTTFQCGWTEVDPESITDGTLKPLHCGQRVACHRKVKLNRAALSHG